MKFALPYRPTVCRYQLLRALQSQIRSDDLRHRCIMALGFKTSRHLVELNILVLGI